MTFHQKLLVFSLFLVFFLVVLWVLHAEHEKDAGRCAAQGGFLTRFNHAYPVNTQEVSN